MAKWRIIENNLGMGKTEYQVSDGDVGERTISFDFDNIHKAEERLYDMHIQELLQIPDGAYTKSGE